jgi:hypothetical protein
LPARPPGKQESMNQHPNHLFRYIAEENLISAENITRLERIMTLPIDEAVELTEDELDESEFSLAE